MNERIYLPLRQVGEITGYAPDYIGFLIRKGEIIGKKKYANFSWLISPDEIIKYCKKNTTLESRETFLLLRKKFLSLKEAAKLSGYSSDYMGSLIRTGKIKGKEIYSGLSWFTTIEEIKKHKNKYGGEEALLNNSRRMFFHFPKYIFASLILGSIIFSGFIAWAFASKNSVQTAEIYPVQIDGDWQNVQNVQGRPEVSASGNINYFSENNSAIYKNGSLSLTLQGFQQTELENVSTIEEATPAPEATSTINEIISEEEIIIEEATSTIESSLLDEDGDEDLASSTIESTSTVNEIIPEIEIATTTEATTTEATTTEEQVESGSLPVEAAPVIDEIIPEVQIATTSDEISTAGEISFLEKIRKIFGAKIARAQQVPTFEELSAKEFQGAKIKFSFAIGEKENDFQIIENSVTGTEPAGFWRGIKNFFGGIFNRLTAIAQADDPTIISEENATTTQDNIISPAPEENATTTEATTMEEIPIEEIATTTEEIINEVTTTEATTAEEQVENGSLSAEATTTEEIINEATTTEATTTEVITTEAVAPETTTTETTSTEEIATTTETTTVETLTNIDAKVIIWWSLDGENWQILDTISSYSLSNAINNGYFALDAPFLKNWEDVKNLKIKFEGVIGGQSNIAAYLDSVWVEADYQEKEKVIEDGFELVSAKNDWQASETPEFRVVHKGEKFQKNIIENLVSDITGIFQEDTKVGAILMDSENKETRLQEGKDFTRETHSSPKIQIFRPSSDFKPGRQTLKVAYEENGQTYNLEQEFTWGVLAINTNKSIYLSAEARAKADLPPETAYLQMASLNDMGSTICDTNLKLEITDPSGATTTPEVQKSGKCAKNNVTDTPDYFAYYQIGEKGTYGMKLTNLDNNYEIADSFEVKKSVPFDVERVGPTRIYPPATYEVTLKIKANEDFQGQIMEQAPADFQITGTNVWDVDWQEGETYELKYQFKAPNVSPYLYLLGPLTFEKNKFTEARLWQIASDAGTKTVIFITASSTSYSVPSDWNSASNTIEVIGGGGGGGDQNANGNGGGGGGGGAYAYNINIALTPGGSVTVVVGQGGTGGNNGTGVVGADTYFCNNTTNCGAIGSSSVMVGARGGTAGGDGSRGFGGTTTNSTGTVKYAGGNGGLGSATGDTAGGGGGSAGYAGAGCAGGSPGGGTNYGSGGGGGGGGTSCTVGLANSTIYGGSGGQGYTGIGGGLGTSTNGGNATGTAGGGGAGGASGNGGNGTTSAYWTATAGDTAGPGGGGGGGGGTSGTGGKGAIYGGGGGSGTTAGAANGGQGIIVLSYWPALLNQNQYIWRDDSTLINTYGGFISATNTTTTVNVASTTRLRIEIANTGVGPASDTIYRIEYASKVGASCDADETFAAVPITAGASPFEMATSTKYNNATTITSSMLPSTGTFTTGTSTGVADPNSTTSKFRLNADNYTEFEYVIVPTANITSDASYCFRLTDNGATGTFSYTQYPELKVHVPAPSITQRAYIFQNDDGANVNSNSTTSAANTTSTAIYKGQRITARFQLDNTGEFASNQSFKLQYDKDQDTRWTNVDFGGAPSSNAGADLKDWNATTVDASGATGRYSSITIGTDGYPVISYYATSSLNFIKCNNPTCTSFNATTVVAASLSEGTSIAIGNDGYPVISFLMSRALNVAHCNDIFCNSVTRTQFPDVTWGVYDYGTAIVIGTDGYPVISTNGYTNRTARVFHCDNIACTSASTSTVDILASSMFTHNSIAIKPSTGFPAISYYDALNGNLKYVECANAACTATSTLTIIDSTNDVGDYTSLAFGNDNNPVISYYDNTAANSRGLRVAKYIGSSGTGCDIGATWNCATLDTDNAGQYSSIAIGTDGLPIISYYASTTGVNYALRVAKCSNNSCNASTSPAQIFTIDTSAADVGQYTSMTIAPDGWPVISYYDVTNSDLKVAKMLPITEIQPSWGLSGTTSDALTTSTISATGASSTAWTNGNWIEASASSSSVTIGINQYTEVAFVLDTSEAVASTTYRLRLVTGTSTVLANYEKYPALTIVPQAQNTKRYSKDAIQTLSNTASSSDWSVSILGSGDNQSIAIGTDGYPVVFYEGPSPYPLIVAKCNNISCSSFSTTTIGNANISGRSSIAIGTDGYPVISYTSVVSPYPIIVAKCNNISCSSFSTTTIGNTSASGRSSIAIGTDGYPVVSYNGPDPWPLIVAKCNNISCSSFSTTTLGSETVYDMSEIVIGTDGYPVISYTNNNAPIQAVVAKCNNISCSSFSPTVIENVTATKEPSISIGIDGYPVIAYYNDDIASFKLLKCSNSSCSSFSSSTLEYGTEISLTINTDGYPVLLNITNADKAKLIKCNNASCSSFSSSTIAVASAIYNYPSIIIGTDGYPVVSYVNSALTVVAKQLGLPKTAIAYFNNYIKTDRQIKYTRNLWTNATTGALWADASPALEDGLQYWYDKADYSGVTTDDSASTSITGSASASATTTPMFVFTNKHATSSNSLYPTWIGQSTVGASTNKIYMDVFRFGSESSTTGWFTIASSTSCGANSDCTLNGSVTASSSEYYFPEYNFNASSSKQTIPHFWTFFRVYQDGGSQNLKTDYWSGTNITISGTVYTDEGSTTMAAGRVVRVKVNGLGTYSADTLSDGTYFISEVTIGATGDTVTAFLDAATNTEKADTITTASSTYGNITGLDLYQNRIIARSGGTTQLSITNLDQYDSASDADILFSATSSTGQFTASSTSEFFVWPSETYNNWGSAVGTTTFTDIDIRGTLNASSSQRIGVSGNWDSATTAAFSAASSTVMQYGTGNFGGTGVFTFYNLTFGNGTAGTTTAITSATATISNVLTIAANQTLNAGAKNWILSSSASVPFSISGVFNAASSTFKYDAGGASWLFGGFSYRKLIPVQNTTSTLVDYQVNITVATTTGGNVTCGGKCRSDFGDIRFTTLDGSTLIDYWIEATSTNGTSSIWLEIPSLAASASTNIYMYYGNAATTTTGSGSSTFVFFDDFESYSLGAIGNQGGWATAGGPSSFVNVVATNSSQVLDTGAMLATAELSPESYHNFTMATSGEYTVRFKRDYPDTFHYAYVQLMDGDTIPRFSLIFTPSHLAQRLRYSGGAYPWTEFSPIITWVTYQWYTIKLRWYANSTVDVYVDGALKQAAAPFSTTTTSWSISQVRFTGGASQAQLNINMYTDDIRIRKYILDPSIGTAGSEETGSPVYVTATTYNNLEISSGSFILATGTSQTINTNGYLSIGDGINGGVITGATYNPILNIDGNITILASSTLIAPASSLFTVAGNWSNSGIFTPSNGTVIFDSPATSTFSGTTTFYNLISTTTSKTLQFATGTSATTTINGTLTLSGQACGTQIKLRSTQSGQYWYLNAMATTAIDYVDIRDSNAAGSANPIVATNASSSGNNVNWSLSLCSATIDVSGTVYSNEGTSALLTAPTINLYVNGTFSASTSASGANGTYSFSSVAVVATNTITAYINNNAATGTVVTVTNAATNIADFDIYQNNIIVRDDNIQEGLSIANMSKWDNDNDPDIKFSATTTGGSTLTVSSPYQLYVWGSSAGKFKPNGTVSTYDLKIASSTSIYTASGTEAITVTNSWRATSTSNFVASSSNVIFTSTRATTTITTGGAPFYNLTFNGSGGIWTFQDAATTTNNLSTAAGTASSTYNMSVYGGNVTGSGTGVLNWTNNTFLVDGTGYFGGVTNWTFNNLIFGDGTGVATTTATATNAITVSGDMSVATNQTLTGSRDFTVNGGDITGNGTINLTAGTFLLDGTGYFGGTSPWNFYNLTFGNGAGTETSTATSTGTTTVSNVLAIAANQTLNAGTKNWVLSSSGTPFSISGVFDAASSTFKYYGTSWLAGEFSYRKLIPVQNTTSTLANYQVNITVATTTGGNVTCGGKCRSNFGDIRFTTLDGSTLIDYWIEATSTNGTSSIWLEIPSLAADATTNIYMYYGKASAVTTSSSTSTFVVMDDFETGNLNRWTIAASGSVPWALTSGVYRKSPGTYSLYDGPSGCGASCGAAYRVVYTWAGALSAPSSDYIISWWRRELSDFGSQIHFWINGTNTFNGDGPDPASFNDSGWYFTTTTYSGTITSFIVIEDDITNQQSVLLDDFFIRNYAVPQPAFGTAGSEQATSSTYVTATTYNNLELPKATNDIFILATGTGQTINTNGYLSIGDGVNSGITTGNTYNPILNVDGNLTIAASSTLIASSAAYYIAGNWSNAGTFTAASGTVIFDSPATSTFSGATVFYNLISTTTSKTLQFATGTSATTTIRGALTLSGQACDTQIKLRSTQSGQYWYLNARATATVSYVDVKDSNATASASTITATNATNSGNNVKWSISGCAAAIAVSGTVYSNEGTSTLLTAPTINLYVNGTFSASTSASGANGTYSFPSVLVSSGNTLTAYINNNAATGTVVTVTDGATNITDFNIYQNNIIVRDDNVQAGLSIASMSYWDNDNDPDIKFSATTTGGSTLTVSSPYQLYVWGNSKGYFTPNGNVSTYDFKFASSTSIYTASGTESITVSNSWRATSTSNFVPDSSTVTFTSTRATTTIATGGAPFYNLTFNGSGGIWTFQDAATTTNDLTITAGTASSSNNMNIYGGDIAGNGIMNWTAGTFSMAGTGYFGGTSAWNFYNLTFLGITTATSTGTTTISNILNIPAGQTLNAGTKPWVLSGSGIPFVISGTGTFSAQSSIFIYTGITTTNIAATTYYDLQFKPISGSPTYNLATATGQTITVNGTTTIGDGTNGVVVTAAAYNPTLDIIGNFTISASATMTASASAGFSVGGNWSNSGGFTHSNGTLVFDAASIGRTIVSGGTSTAQSFYNVDFNNVSGGWTIQTNNLLAANNFYLTNASSFTVASGRTVEVKGGFTNAVGGAATTWTGSTLYLNKTAGGYYSINTKTAGGDVYATLQIGANTEVRAWNSYSATNTVNSTGSLFSQDYDVAGDGTGDDGILYIWSDYHSTTTDYCSYNTDFDSTDISGSPRQCQATLNSGASWTVDAGATLNVIGGGLASGDISIIGQGASVSWNFGCLGTCNVRESTWNYSNFSSGTTTVVNTVLNNEGVSSSGVLNNDWYLGVHLVDKNSTSTNVDTGATDITISEASASSTIYKWSGSVWQGPYVSTTTGTLSTGKIPDPTSATEGAIRIREYSRTASATTTYKYNLAVAAGSGFSAYNYYNNYGNNYLTATSSSASGVDKTIYEGWQRNTVATMNSPYACPAGTGDQCINEPPTNGSWYIGMASDLQASIDSGTVYLDLNIYSLNILTATATNMLTSTTSYANGFNVTAYASDNGRLRLGASSDYIIRWPNENLTPAVWSGDCTNDSQCGFGYTTSDNSLYNGSTYDNRFANGTNFAGFATTTPGNRLADSTGPVYATTTLITYKASVLGSQVPGDYVGTIYYIWTPNY